MTSAPCGKGPSVCLGEGLPPSRHRTFAVRHARLYLGIGLPLRVIAASPVVSRSASRIRIEGRTLTDIIRMGRPSLGVRFTAIRLTPEMLARIDALAGPKKRSEFIRLSVEAELARREKG